MNIDHNILRTTIIQPDIIWENSAANFDNLTRIIKSLQKETDLIILPETFSTGFTMNVEDNADDSGNALAWMRNISGKRNTCITGSVIIKEGTEYFNRLYFVKPDGTYSYYNKRHLFRMGREDRHFTAGSKRIIVTAGKFRIILQTCYDLRFPVFVRNRGDYDAIIYVANWPESRQFVWDSLLVARAIENQAFVMASNRVGTDGEGVSSIGGSIILDPKGKTIGKLDHNPGVLQSEINLYELNDFRKKFKAFKDADDFELLM